MAQSNNSKGLEIFGISVEPRLPPACRLPPARLSPVSRSPAARLPDGQGRQADRQVSLVLPSLNLSTLINLVEGRLSTLKLRHLSLYHKYSLYL